MTWRVEFTPIHQEAELTRLRAAHGLVMRDCLIPQRSRLVEFADHTVWESDYYQLPGCTPGWGAWVATGPHSYTRYLRRRRMV